LSSLKRKIFLILIIIAVILFSGSYILKNTAPLPEIHNVKILESARSPYFLPQYLALNLGFFKEQNLAVKIITTSPAAISAAMADGRTEIVLCGLQNIIFNPDREGPQPKIFATMSSRDGSFLLARKNTEEFQWEKLKDQTIIGGSQNDSSEIALEYALRQREIRPNREVTIYNNIPDSLRPGAFRAGTGSYIQLLEPEATIVESKGYGQAVFSVGEAAGNMMVTAYAALPGYIATNPEVIQKFTNAIYKAQLWLFCHSATEAAAVVAPSFADLDRTVLLKSIERYLKLQIWNDSPQVYQNAYVRFCTAAKEAGEIETPAAYADVVENCFANQAVKTVKYTPEEKNNFFKKYINRFLSK
jgi:NitT/TauT family transport system substrate-binding protein